MMKRLMTMMSVLIVMALGAQSAMAGMVMYTSTVNLQDTNWSDAINDIPEFNDGLAGVPTGSVLTKVTVKLTGEVAGTGQYESLDGDASVVTLTLQAVVTLTTPAINGIMDVVVNPLAAVVDNASAFDTVIDFGGTSGGTFGNLNGTDMTSEMYTSAADLAAFSGLGFLNMPIDAAATSNASGAGNIVTQFNTDAGAEVKVTYEFRTNDVPEPASALLLGLGCMALLNRPKRSRRA